MNKKAIAILGLIFILIVGTLGFLVYTKYFPKTDSPVVQNPNATTTPENSNPATTTPIVTQNPEGAVKLADDQVVSPALFYDGSGITYFDNKGNLFQASINENNGQIILDNKKKLDIPLKPNIKKILWPAKGSDFIAEFLASDGKKTWSYFNSIKQIYTDLPTQITSVSWMPNGNQIMYVWLDNNKSTLNIGDSDSRNWKFVGDMWENDDEIVVSPDGLQILYYETENAGITNPINSVTTDGKVWKTVVANGQNFGVVWSPDGQKFLFGKKDPSSQKYQLWLYNLASGEVKNLGLFTTVDKAYWDKDSNVIFVSVPNSGSAGGDSLTQDTFFRMDTSTLEKKQYDSGSLPIDGRDLFLNSTGDKLFFKNAQDGGLYYLDLTK